jgi:spermidine synthase
MPRSATTAAVLALAALSGAAALTYEVVWFRELGLVLGVASHSVAAVVGAFMLGLGLGAWLAGRCLARARPLHAYAWVELGIALFALASPSLLDGLRTLVHTAWGPFGTAAGAFGGAIALLLVPTVAMGATFPLLGRVLAALDGPGTGQPTGQPAGEHAGRHHSAAAPKDAAALGRTDTRIGWLYGVNTLGAAAGTLLAAYHLLPEYGARGTTLVAALANGIVALVAFGLAPLVGGASAAATQPSAPAPAPTSAGTTRAPSSSTPLGLLAASALVGMAALVLQVLANRLIVSLLGGAVYVFGAIVAVFLIGIASGGLFGGALARRAVAPTALLGRIALLFCGAIGLGLAVLTWRTGGGDLLAGPDNLSLLRPGEWPEAISPLRYLARTFELAFLALLPATFLSGAFLPAAVATARAGAQDVGRAIGAVYAANTLGSIAGSVLAAFVLLPGLGLRGGFACALALALAAGLLLIALARRRGEALRPTSVVVCGTLALLGCGALVRGEAPGASEGLATVFHAESAASGAKVQEFTDAAEPEPIRNLRVNGKTVASSIFIDRRLQYLLGFVSTLVHPEPRRLLCIGLGTGMTSAAMATAGGDLTVVEISPAVVDAARHFATWNEDLHARADTTIVVDDGRAWLTRTEQRFDVISADPIDPCVSGSAYLYTLEYYELGRARLAPGGLMSQWIPLYDLSPADIAGIVLTFQGVFPHATAWVTGYDMMLIGSEQPLALDPRAIDARIADPRTRALLGDVGIESAEELIGTCFAGPATLAALAALADRPNTDDDPWIEFSAPRAAFGTFPLPVFRALASGADPLPLHPDVAGGLLERTALAFRAELQAEMLAFVTDVETGQGYGRARTRYITALRSDD